ncbi:MAG: Nuclear envelope morphology protein 1 [Chrysothrix sp. TS-e1954]|nr:MAG: Nuclear envelope morphology protein 1 [Chrysothrix sp. TS-e1954]
MLDEKTPLLQHTDSDVSTTAQSSTTSRKVSIPRKLSQSISGTFTIVVSAVLAPGRYLIACFYDEEGRFSAALPVYRLKQKLSRKPGKRRKPAMGSSSQARIHTENEKQIKIEPNDEKPLHTTFPSSGSGSADALPDQPFVKDEDLSLASSVDTPSQHTRSKSFSSSTSETSDPDPDPPKRSIRIKTVSGDALRQRRQRREQRETTSSIEANSMSAATLADRLKSPTRPNSPSRATSITKYPRAPAAPRPLIPRRQPSYTYANAPPLGSPPKTLVIDLDETLIHSMAKGGKMSTGHMVEVKLQMPVGVGNSVFGPQVPILYYVHKRPHCDEFLRKVSKWYNLIAFTASVQEYADPVIDWLELERKYFSARYYRQHCTFRNGAYIKDLSLVEPDLSKVMILDNSPMSYIFHEDNAIPIEGWISDPTDNDLLHLIPLLEGLQYTTDILSVFTEYNCLSIGGLAVMQKVLRRVNLANNQAVRRKRLLEEKQAAYDRREVERSARIRDVEIKKANKRAHFIHREAWTLGKLSPLNSPAILDSQTYGTFTMKQSGVPPPKPKPQQRKDFFIAVGDRVCVVNGRDGIRGKIGKVTDVDEAADTVALEGVNLMDVAVFGNRMQQSLYGDIRHAFADLIPVDDVRLVYPLPDPSTGVPRDTLLRNLVRRNDHFDIYKNEKVWDRYLEPQHVRIPWPEKDEPEHIDRDGDTLRINVEEASFLPSLLRPPMPLGVIDELRKRTSKFRDRHDPEYVAKKMAEDDAEQAASERARRQMPRGARNVARTRWRSPDNDPTVHMSDNIAEAIGKHITQKANSVPSESRQQKT